MTACPSNTKQHTSYRNNTSSSCGTNAVGYRQGGLLSLKFQRPVRRRTTPTTLPNSVPGGTYVISSIMSILSEYSTVDAYLTKFRTVWVTSSLTSIGFFDIQVSKWTNVTRVFKSPSIWKTDYLALHPLTTKRKRLPDPFHLRLPERNESVTEVTRHGPQTETNTGCSA